MDLLLALAQVEEALATKNKRCPSVLGRLPTCANQRPTGRIPRIISAGSPKTTLGDGCATWRRESETWWFAKGEDTSKG